MQNLTFITGGARSGKSLLAEQLARTFSQAGLLADARTLSDVGTLSDARNLADAGTLSDARNLADARTLSDAGTLSDARSNAAAPGSAGGSPAHSPVIYLASMQVFADDPELERRIQLHKSRRPSHWTTIESPFNAHETIRKLPPAACVVFDCLSLYLTNILLASTSGADKNPYEAEAEIFADLNLLLDEMEKRSDLQFIIVTNEVGSGLVPETRLGRAFRDFLGLANQAFAARANAAYICASGIPIKLK